MELKISKEVESLITTTSTMLSQYQGYKVQNEQEFSEASEISKQVKMKYNALESERKKLKEPIIDAGKRIDQLFKEPLERLLSIESILKTARLVYYDEQEKKRREEEAKIAELQRKEAEKLEKRAEKAETKGNIEKAEELRAKAQDVESIVPVVQVQTPKHAGVSFKSTWEFEVIDINKVPREYMIVNEPMLSKVANATKGTLKIEGIEFKERKIISDRVR